MNTPFEIGSFFHEMEQPNKRLPSNYRNKFANAHFAYTGTQSLLQILYSIEHKYGDIKTLYVPSFYCLNVYPCLGIYQQKIDYFNQAKSHEIMSQTSPDSLAVILVNNTFGLGKCHNIEGGNKNVFVIEDHSHAWGTEECENSRADYCFSSLRKSYPIPLGAVAWSPKNHEFQESIPQPFQFNKLWEQISKSQQLKRQYLEGADVNKETYLKGYSQSEEALLKSKPFFCGINEIHQNTVKEWSLINVLEQKQKNNHYIISKIKKGKFEILSHANNSQYGLILKFNSFEEMNRLKQKSIAHQIYPAFLWPDNTMDFGYHLIFHTDFRYHTKEMDCIAQLLNDY